MQNDMRDRLVELYKEATTLYFDYLDSIDEKGLTDTEGRAEFTIDHLIANGVVLPQPKTPIDLKGKCGSCIYAKPTTFGNSTIYVECTNIEHLARFCCNHKLSKKRQRTHKACKNYKAKEQAEQKLKELSENAERNIKCK